MKVSDRTAIDVTDGFLADLHHICLMSRVNALVDIDELLVIPFKYVNQAGNVE